MDEAKGGGMAAGGNEALKARLIDIIKARSFQSGKEIKLASGRTSTYYFNMKPTMLDAEGAHTIATLILEAIAGMKPDLVGGLEMGAVPIASAVAAVSRAEGRPVNAFFVRKQAKEHGTQSLVEGLPAGDSMSGKRVVIVEDVTTTGGSAIKAAEALRAEGAEIVGVVTIVDREEGAADAFAAAKPLYCDVHTAVVNGASATRETVAQALIELVRTEREDDLAIVFFSSHGGWSPTDGYSISLAKEGKQWGTLRGNELLQVLSAARGRVIVLLDTCCAAGIIPQDNRALPKVSFLVACQRDEDQPLEQIIMPAPHDTMRMSSGKDLKPFLEFLRRDNWLPVAAQCLGRDAFFRIHNPASIGPVVKDVRHGVVVDFAFAIGFYFDERTTTPIVITACVKFLSNLFERKFIC